MKTVQQKANDLLCTLGLTIEEASIGIGKEQWFLYLYPPAHNFCGKIPLMWHDMPILVERVDYPVAC